MSEYTDKMHSPSPAHGGTSAIRVADDCLDSVLSAAECDCIPNEFQCVKHGAMDELRTLRARLAALTRENERLRTVFECEEVAYKRVCAERDAERARAEKARGDAVAVVETFLVQQRGVTENVEVSEAGRYHAYHAVIVLSSLMDKLRALAHDEGRGT